MTTDTTPAAPVKKKRRILLKTIGVLLLLILIGLAVVYFTIDGIIRNKVIAATHTSTGQVTTLDAARLLFSDRKLTLTRLDIGNPQGFSAPQFVTLGSCAVTVQPRTLMSDTVVIDDIHIDGLTVTIEQLGPDKGFKNNLSEVINFVQGKRTSAEGKPATAAGEPGTSKQLKIGKLRMTNCKLAICTLNLQALGGKPQDFVLDLPPIEMLEPTNPDGRLMKVADLIGKVLLHIAHQVASNPQIPGELKNGLKSLESLIQGDVLKDLSKMNLQNVGKDLPGGLKDATKNLDNLKNLNPFDKKK